MNERSRQLIVPYGDNETRDNVDSSFSDTVAQTSLEDPRDIYMCTCNDKRADTLDALGMKSRSKLYIRAPTKWYTTVFWVVRFCLPWIRYFCQAYEV